MTRKMALWASNDGQIIKSGPPNDRRAKFLPSVVGIAYDWLRYECHLGNVGLGKSWALAAVAAAPVEDLGIWDLGTPPSSLSD